MRRAIAPNRLVPRPALQRRRPPAHQSAPLAANAGHVPERLAYNAVESHVMMLPQQFPPARPLFTPHQAHCQVLPTYSRGASVAIHALTLPNPSENSQSESALVWFVLVMKL